MTQLIYGQDKAVSLWVAKKLPHIQIDSVDKCVAIGISSNDGEEMFAGAVYYNYKETDIEMSFASDNPKCTTARNIGAVLAYPFVQLGVQRITSVVMKSNKRMRRLLEGIGFVNEGTVRHAFKGKNGNPINGILYGMVHAESEKWLRRLEDGKRIQSTKAA